MKLSVSKRPSPAIIVAVAALAFAMVGTAVAGTDGLSAKLTKSKVKSIAKKQADKELKANVSGSHVNLADNATNATNATNANTAASVGGQTPAKLFTKIPSGTGATTVFSGNGLNLTAACSAAGLLTFVATTSVADSIFGSAVINTGSPGGIRSSDFDPGDTLDVKNGLPRGAGTFTYSQPNGTFVSGQFLADDSNTLGTSTVAWWSGAPSAADRQHRSVPGGPGRVAPALRASREP